MGKVLTKKRRVLLCAWFTILAGAALWKWSDKGSGTLLMAAGIWVVGKLGREAFPEAHRRHDDPPSGFSDGDPTPAERKITPTPKDVD